MTKTKDDSILPDDVVDRCKIIRQYARQGNRCYGCFRSYSSKELRWDGKGLICYDCGLILTHIYQDDKVLRRLIAYREYDPSKTRVYLIGALKNERIPKIGNKLRAEGLDTMDEWYTPGKHADENWQKYEKIRGRTYAEALRGRAATNIFLFDRVYIELSDIVVLVMPVGKSAMIELGYAKGIGKKVIIFLDGKEPERYDIMPAFADKIVKTEKELIAELHK